MIDVTGLGLTERSRLAFLLTVFGATAVFVGVQLVAEGDVNGIAAVTFAGVFAVILVGLAWLRDRYFD